MKFKRYAIYYIPEMDAEFYKSGTKWLGWDVFTGKKKVNNKDHITKNARRYGFHGTLYPPFELKSKINFNDFEKSVDQFAKNKKAFDMGKGKITKITNKYIFLFVISVNTKLHSRAWIGT